MAKLRKKLRKKIPTALELLREEATVARLVPPPAHELLELDEIEQSLVAAHEAEARRLEGEAEQLAAAARESRLHPVVVIARKRGLLDGKTRLKIDWSEEGVPRLALDRSPASKES